MRQRQGQNLSMRRDASIDSDERNRLNERPLTPADRFSDLGRAKLAQRLDRLADVRADVVARGRKLVANPHYPEKEIIRQVSRLLARHLAR